MIRLVVGISLFYLLLGAVSEDPATETVSSALPAVEVRSEVPSPESAPLPIAPSEPEIDPDKPSWVGQPPKLERGVYTMSVPSGLYVTRLECERALDVAMHTAVAQYAEDYLGVEAAELVSIDDRYIKNFVQKEEYAETVVRSVGEMQQVFAKLEFNDQVRAEIMNRYRAAIVHMRLWTFGSGALAILALLGTLFGYLKLDHLTSGHHRRRLQWAAAVTILGVVAGAALIQTQAFTARL